MSVEIGVRLRMIRQRWQLSLREVEERSLLVVRQRGNESHRVSASWLVRLERGEHELTVSKLLALADIYKLPAERLLSSLHPGNPQPMLRHLSIPNATMPLTEGALDEQAKYLFAGMVDPGQLPDETLLLAPGDETSQTPYRRGILGQRDCSLEPMIPAGSIVHFDTKKRAISLRKSWISEFQRPIYFLMTRDGYVCGWCELDRNSEWLTLVPHPLSSASSRRWKYRTEIESMGRVVAVAIRLVQER